VNVHSRDARKTRPGATCSGVLSPGATVREYMRVAATRAMALTRIPWGRPTAASSFMSPN
jgi:hypothetical protein